MKFVACLLLFVVSSLPTHAARTPAPPDLTPEQAGKELRLLRRALVELHPGLYRYQTPAGLDLEFERAQREVAQGASPGTMYRLASRLSASVRCGHTWTNPVNQGSRMREALDALPVLPMTVRVVERRLLVTASATPAVRASDEILDIDGRPFAQIVEELMPYLRADGASDGKRLAQLDSNAEGGVLDRLLPLLHPPRDGHYTLRLRRADGRAFTRRVAATTAPVRDRRLLADGTAGEDLSWRFAITGDTAVLTLPTFAFWNASFDWKAYLQQTFETLAQQNVRHLVLDLRQNEGGDSAIGQALLGYLIADDYGVPAGRVVLAYERVPYLLARYLDTWDFGFFDRTGKVTRNADGTWRYTDPPAAVRIQPAAPRFSGTVAALIGPRMSSAGFLLARDLRASGRAVLIGEPTGGNRRGLNGGQIAWLTLPYSGVAVDIPLQATVHDDEPDAPILPDVPVPTTVEDVVAKRDAAREKALTMH